MACTSGCIRPTPSQAHCGCCHVTFGGVRGFDSHRRGGECSTPESIGLLADRNGVWRAQMDEASVARLKDAASA